MQAKADDFAVDLPERPEAEGEATDWDERDWLLDASRDYLDQIVVYQARKNRRED